MKKIKRGTPLNLQIRTDDCFSTFDILRKVEQQLKEYDVIEPDLSDKEVIPFIMQILKINHPNGQFKLNPANTLSMTTISTEELINKLQEIQNKAYKDAPCDKKDNLTKSERMIYDMINDHVYNRESIDEDEVREWMNENFLPVLLEEIKNN